jgi:hypothetical protein
MRLTAFLLSMILLAVACQETQAPDDLVSVERMTAVLKDFHLGDAAVAKDTLTPEQRSFRREEMQQLILEKYSLDPQTFFSSYEYYLTQPVLMDTIYTRIINQLNKQLPLEQEERYQKFKEEPQKRQLPAWQK